MSPTLAVCLDRRQDNFLLLRFIAAALVIYGHSTAITGGTAVPELFSEVLNWDYYSGAIAVDIFFIISGFMVAASYARNPRPLQFVAARLLRIIPAYAVCVTVSALVIGALCTYLAPADYYRDPVTWAYLSKAMLFGADLVWDLPGVFLGNPKLTTFNGSLWTIPAEMRMYGWVLLFGLFGLLSRRWLANVALLLLGIAAILAPSRLPGFPVEQWLRLGGLFALGTLAYVNREHVRASGRLLLVLVLAAWLLRPTVAYAWVFALAECAFVFWFAYRLPWRGFNRFGDASYGVYLWGFPVQQLVAQSLPDLNSLAHTAVALPIAILLGALSWRFIEKPMLAYKGIIRGPVVGAADQAERQVKASAGP